MNSFCRDLVLVMDMGLDIIYVVIFEEVHVYITNPVLGWVEMEKVYLKLLSDKFAVCCIAAFMVLFVQVRMSLGEKAKAAWPLRAASSDHAALWRVASYSETRQVVIAGHSNRVARGELV